MNLAALERVILDGKKAMSYAATLRTQVKTAEQEEARQGSKGAGYMYMRALLSSGAWDSADFYKYICPAEGVKALVKQCVEFATRQEVGVEEEVMRLVKEAADVDQIGVEAPKLKREKKVSAETIG